MRCIDPLGNTADYIERHAMKSHYYPCPKCGRKGKRRQVVTRRVQHVAALHRRSWMVAEVGVYHAQCTCCQYVQAAAPGVPHRGRYAYEVRTTIANALIRDRMPYGLVSNRMQEDYHLSVSLGYVHACFNWAHEHINMEAHWAFVASHFSGILCVDEVHDSGRTIVFATDPLNNFTVSFQVVEKNDQDHMDAFLHTLKDRGVVVVVAMTDGSPLYKDRLPSHWKGLEHPLGIFQVIKEVNTLIVNGVRAIKNQIKRQGNTGRKKRRGRPGKRVRQQRQRRQGMTKKDQATFIWEHQYLIVRKDDELSDQDRDAMALMFQIAPELELFRRCNQQFYRLFEPGITKQCARYRRTRMVNNAAYQANSFLAKALKKIRKDTFNKMIVFLGWDNVDRTSNHVERNNRVFRMLQKTRYKRRRVHTIEKALELDLYARMLAHPLCSPTLRERHLPLGHPCRQKMAA